MSKILLDNIKKVKKLKKINQIVLWPIYFDSTRSKSEGRKVPKNIGVPSPNVGIIDKALSTRNLSHKIIEKKAYPRFSWNETGYLLVERKKPKNQLLKEIAKEISKITDK